MLWKCSKLKEAKETLTARLDPRLDLALEREEYALSYIIGSTEKIRV